MTSLIAVPLLVVLTLFQEQISSLSLNIPASPGYYQDGDFVIGGLFSLRVTAGDTRSRFGFQDTVYIPDYVFVDFTKHYQHLLAMVFAIEKINKNRNLLFNMSLGFYLFNVDYIEMKAMESSMSLVSGESPPVPNYSCWPEKRDKLVAVIGGISSGISTQISQVLSLYNIPQLHPFLEKSQLERSAKKKVVKETSTTKFDIFNYQVLADETKALVEVGEFIFESHSVQHFSFNDKLVSWGQHHSEPPFAACSPGCSLGFRKSTMEGKQFCCFDCLLCPDGEIANETDMDQCIRCPEDQYPNEESDRCLPKIMMFLSHEDTLGAVLGSLAVGLSVVSALVLGLFIHHRDTPIVRANNRNLSYTLLVSLTLCFFCSLMFIGQPGTLTCILRQMLFGVVFSVAVSAILAKTFIVVVAFKAIKPGNTLQMWMVTRLSNLIVACGSLIQVCICAVWLATYPPFPDMDTQAEFGKIILQCNEGSTIAFYCVLGYLGFLALLSLVIAFLARRLPDSFNEAKMITFSMVVFCSVWISFIPTYLSTKGKTMVAVEILSILASSAGLLGCIFLPKCYVILLRSTDNSRKKLLQQGPSFRKRIY